MLDGGEAFVCVVTVGRLLVQRVDALRDVVVVVVGVGHGPGFGSGFADEIAAAITERPVLRDAGAGHRDADELVGAVVGVRGNGTVGGSGSGGRVRLVDGGDVAEGVQDVGFPDSGGVRGGHGVS